jgi:hypothetical protein
MNGPPGTPKQPFTPQPPPTDDDDLGLDDEETACRRWNYMRLRRDLHLPRLEARMLAEAGVSWHEADRLIRRGCPPDQTCRILL